ncbi:MAG: FAD-dependent oxidoreductase [Planctomycetia bacterium]|nr:FAD-dependent oxidoreductase [Planctomycetia bacterium]
MTNSNYKSDIIILGAGINGSGIARELAMSGKTITVIDKSTIGSGTSSKSSRLIHGGLRYLETLQFKLVREALLDRQELLKIYPDLVKMKSFYIPIYKPSPRPAWMIWFGLKFYDLLSGKNKQHHSRVIPRKQFNVHAASFKQEGLKAVFHYYDAKTNDLQLTQRVAQDAIENGASFYENTFISTITNNKEFFIVRTSQGDFTAPILINASGPWIDEVNSKFEFPAKFSIRKISGIHITIEGLLTNDLMFMQTKQKRIFFIIPEPENNQTLIGTTEREETDLIDDITIREEDILYLIENINNYLKPGFQILRKNVKDAFIGVRPLVAEAENPTNLSREYELDKHTFGNTTLLHVFGGKLTTYLSLARKVRKTIFS